VELEEILLKLIDKSLEPINSKLDFIIENMVNLGQGKPVMNLKEASKYIGKSYSWLSKNYEIENIPYFRLGGNPVFNKEDLDKWRLAKSEKPKRKVIIRNTK